MYEPVPPMLFEVARPWKLFFAKVEPTSARMAASPENFIVNKIRLIKG